MKDLLSANLKNYQPYASPSSTDSSGGRSADISADSSVNSSTDSSAGREGSPDINNTTGNTGKNEEDRHTGQQDQKASTMKPSDLKPDPKRKIIKMNANESPYTVPKAVLDQALNSLEITVFNFYPDTDSTELRQAIGKFLAFPPEQILVGNGSDEMIDVLLKTFVAAGDGVVSHDPTFSMYQIFTELLGGKYYGVPAPSDEDFAVNISGIIEKANQVGAKAVFLCTPNNPTGRKISKDQVLRVLEETRGMVVIDEAYREFSDQDFLPLLTTAHPRLIILRTFSKANGLAGVRGGYLLGSPEAVSYMQQVKPPYNLNVVTQKLLTAYLNYLQTREGSALIEGRILEIRREREMLYRTLQDLPGFRAYPGAGNFISFRVQKHRDTNSAATDKNSPGGSDDAYGAGSQLFDDAYGATPQQFDETLDGKLLTEGFQIKKFRHQNIPYYRISLGTPKENRQLIETLQGLYPSDP
ncbi:pyridoxal phosphate-dependent aminotransferase [Isachenkonia alkalipeptolytica]|nr:aminotransferase class I/II-fold pyridoxal phosphate-dependent enzyme [Isachenkonia alkalipeptolytica]